MYETSKFDASFDGVVVDLRSDTLTLPTHEMRQAMFDAVVGDDVFGEDPTIIDLECRVATLLGKESGLFVPSGTMSNLIAVMTHCNDRGSEMFVGDKSHIFLYEQGGASYLGGVHPSVLPNLPDGTFDLDLLASKIRGDDPHLPRSKLICVENSHNSCGGKALPLEWLKKLLEVKTRFGLPVHVDGARLLNSALYQNVPITDLTEVADSISFCLSKGIGAPVGSVLVGTRDFIRQAKRYRKALGGGMRQSGVLAAAAHVALDGVDHRLKADHENAKIIVESLAEAKSSKVTSDPASLHTNIVLINVNDGTADEFVDRLEKVSDDELKSLPSKVVVRGLAIAANVVRLVLNGNISRPEAEMAAQKLKFVAENWKI